MKPYEAQDIPIETILVASENPPFGDRLEQQLKNEEDLVADAGTRWTDILGDYSTLSLTGERLKSGSSELTGLEITMDALIQQTLLKSRTGNPAVFLDVGGGMGLSFVKLARKYENFIETGRLLMVVTNLEGTAETVAGMYWGKVERLGVDGASLAGYTHTDYMKFKETWEQGQVKYLKAGARDLKTLKVKDYLGNEIRIWKNCCLVYERSSVTQHTLTPEIDVPNVMGCTKQGGGVYVLVWDSTKGSPPPQVWESATNFGLERANTINQGPNADMQIHPDIIVAKNGREIKIVG